MSAEPSPERGSVEDAAALAARFINSAMTDAVPDALERFQGLTDAIRERDRALLASSGGDAGGAELEYRRGQEAMRDQFLEALREAGLAQLATSFTAENFPAEAPPLPAPAAEPGEAERSTDPLAVVREALALNPLRDGGGSRKAALTALDAAAEEMGRLREQEREARLEAVKIHDSLTAKDAEIARLRDANETLQRSNDRLRGKLDAFDY